MKTITRFFAIVAISLATVGAFAQPTTTLTPTVTAANAKFTYNSSGAFTNAALMTMSNDDAWGGLFVPTSYAISGKNVICLTPSNTAGGAGVYYHGATLASTIDVSGMKYLHLDVWVPTALEFTNLGVSPISTGGNQYLYNLQSAAGFTKGSWNKIDIPLTHFTGWAASPVNLSSIFQFIVKSDQAAGITSIPNNTIYLDNIYYWTDVTVTLGVSASSVSIAQPANSTGNFAVTATQNWTAASNQTWLTISPKTGTSAGATLTCTATANTTFSNRTATVTVTGTDNVTKMVTVTQAGLTVVVGTSPTPTVASANVKSLFSDAYTSAFTGVTFNPGWGQATSIADYTPTGGNVTKKYSAFNYSGITFGALDLSSMTKLHVDIFPTTETVIHLSPINTSMPAGPTKEGDYTLSLTANQWNSFDILLTDIGINLSAVDQFIFKLGTSGIFYMDNLVFYKGTWTSSTGFNQISAAPALKCFMNSGKLNVSSSSEISIVNVRNILGQNLKTEVVNANSKIIDLSGLASGNYILVAKMTNGQVSTQKFSKL